MITSSFFKSKKESDDYFSKHLAMVQKSRDEYRRKYVNEVYGGDNSRLNSKDYSNIDSLSKILLDKPYGYNADASQITRLWRQNTEYFEKGKGKGGGGGYGGGGGGGGKGNGAGAGNQKQEPKKEPPPPDTSPKLVSFGKMFLSFCLPALTVTAKEQGVDEVQVNFYQLNESCGPISLHCIAEFPVEISFAEQAFADFCMTRGGESMSVIDFLGWASSTLFGDQRAVGYGMRKIVEPKKDPATDKDQKSDAKPDDKKGPMTDWFQKYGEFKPPAITMKMDTFYENDGNKLDLLYKLQYTVGGRYNPPPERFKLSDPEVKDKRILRVDIYDRTYNPFSKQSKLFKDKEGNYKVFETDVTEDEKRNYIKSYARQYAGPGGSEIGIQTNLGSTQNITIDGVAVGKTIAKGANVLRDFVGETVATIVVGGTNATMVYNAQVQSKMDGVVAAINYTGGSYKSHSTVSPNALTMAQNNLPVRALPIEVNLTTVGCPLASIHQEYFLDFETGTTMDNLYKSTQVQHNFSPGKYETAWTFKFTDGYSKFFGATAVDDELRAMGVDTKQKEEALEAADQAQIKEISVEETPVNNAKTTKK